MTDQSPVWDARAEADLSAAVAALETAQAPIPATALPAFTDPALLAEVSRRLELAGRQLVWVEEGGLLSGYHDTVADRLATEGLGILAEFDRAVLATVLLLGVAIPRAEGRLGGSDWRRAEPVTVEELSKNPHLTPVGEIHRSLQRLRVAGILTTRNTPGPQFQRLSPERSRMLWENLILLSRPTGYLAAEIRRRRNAADPARGTDD